MISTEAKLHLNTLISKINSYNGIHKSRISDSYSVLFNVYDIIVRISFKDYTFTFFDSTIFSPKISFIKNEIDFIKFLLNLSENKIYLKVINDILKKRINSL